MQYWHFCAFVVVAALLAGQVLAGPIVAWGRDKSKEVSAVPAGDDYVSLSLGAYWGLALHSGGSAVGWGGAGDSAFTAAAAAPAGTFTRLAGGGMSSAGVRSDGTMAAWGTSSAGLNVAPPGTFSDVSGGFRWMLALRQNQQLAAWGSNKYCVSKCFPAGTYTAIAAGNAHGVAIKPDGSLKAWGNTTFGQTDVPDGTFTAVSAGGYFSVAIRSDGTLAAWGKGDVGQLNVPGGTFTRVSCGQRWALALRTDMTLAAWGEDDDGQVSNIPQGWYAEIGAGGFFGAAIPVTFLNPPGAGPEPVSLPPKTPA